MHQMAIFLLSELCVRGLNILTYLFILICLIDRRLSNPELGLIGD